jgi:response regulator RpfG family c-di-GMP phosphodiesterase
MKIIRNTNATESTNDAPSLACFENSRYKWKVLIVDDEPDIRTLTRISLRDFSFAHQTLEFIEAGSAAEAIELLKIHDDIALALVDVVMETDDAGLKLVEYIRYELKNTMIRLVIRTGQPGLAPERYVIDHYDIDDYKDKTELTAARLYTTVRSALKAFRDLQTIDANRRGLERVLQATPAIYQLGNAPLSEFFNGMLTQMIALCRLSNSSHIGSLEGVIMMLDNHEPQIRASTEQIIKNPRFEEIHQQCLNAILLGEPIYSLRNTSEVLPLIVAEKPVGYIYIEPIEALSDVDRNLINIFARQCSHALENHELHSNILASFESAIDMLAEIAEYKDKATGGHVNRLDFYTRAIAIEMGVSEKDAALYGKASRLHDVGKVGIPDYILVKPSRLAFDEFEIIKKHTTIGANILSHDSAFELARQIAVGHHEFWNGSGYPSGIESKELPLAVRIVSVADVFDALVSWRPYKEPWIIQKARDAIQDGAGTQFDPAVVEAFLKLLDNGEFHSVINAAHEIW